MQLKHIFLPLTGEPGGEDSAVCALDLAKASSAHVTAAYDDELGPAYPNDMGPHGTVAYGAFYTSLQTLRNQRAAEARRQFDVAIAATHLPIVSAPVCNQASAMWIDTNERRPDASASYAALADLSVVGLPGNEARFAGWNVAQSILFDARRPLLVVPPGLKAVDFSTPLIAWNGSAEAVRALQSALLVLSDASRITLVQVGDLADGRIPLERAAEHLGWHCLNTDVKQVADTSGVTAGLLQEAKTAGASCIVMGAYTHSRTREFLLGGVTDSLLRECSFPILMAH
jgi:nucleotide-binding universal stress UspA family protein